MHDVRTHARTCTEMNICMLLPIDLLGQNLLNVKCLMVESKLDWNGKKEPRARPRTGTLNIVLLRTQRPQINTENGE
jgi:hypothetical protein